MQQYESRKQCEKKLFYIIVSKNRDNQIIRRKIKHPYIFTGEKLIRARPDIQTSVRTVVHHDQKGVAIFLLFSQIVSYLLFL